MTRLRRVVLVLLTGLIIVLPAVSQPPASSPPKPKSLSPPRLTPIAETKLLMEGLNHPNFLALERTLKADKIEPESWTFARGQALLIAETGNLLMMRPPRNSGQD